MSRRSRTSRRADRMGSSARGRWTSWLRRSREYERRRWQRNVLARLRTGRLAFCRFVSFSLFRQTVTKFFRLVREDAMNLTALRSYRLVQQADSPYLLNDGRLGDVIAAIQT